jgi:glycosyltransferase involved in cell wall biosynthesis
MRTAAVHQFIPTWEPSAVGWHAFEIRRALLDAGIDSEVFTDESLPGLPMDAHGFLEYGTSFAARSDDVLLYHSAVGSRVAQFVGARAERLIVDYHNITPPEYFADWEPLIASNLELGRDQLVGLGSRVLLGLADSSFNAGELVGCGFGAVTVVPILLDVDALVRSASVGVRWPGGDGARWLFVGRVAPNKAQHDVVKAFAWYRRVFDASASLVLVGGASSGSYWVALQRFVAELGLADAVRLAGSVRAEELEGLYRSADVFVCLSEHEGFCVPLLEAMAHDVPVVAFDAAAVGETLGDAGVLLDTKRPAFVAEAVARVLGDTGLRRALVEAGRCRVQLFDLARSRRKLLDALAPFIDAA